MKKEILEILWIIIRTGYYGIFLVLGMLGIIQVFETSEPTELNVVVTIVSCFSIRYTICGFIKIFKEK